MKKCNTELMKEIKLLTDKKKELINRENNECFVTFTEHEKAVESTYDYKSTRANIKLIDEEIRKYKALLADSNATTIVPEFNMTIGECLIYLGQLKERYDVIKPLSNRNQIERISSSYSSKIEYRKYLFNIDEVKEECESIARLINDVQTAIDRTNLTNQIEL